MKWKLVPVEPTDEMVWKAEEDSPEFHHGDPWYGSEPPSEGQINAIYSAMLEAAPNPPVLSDERIMELAVGCAPALILDPVLFARAVERELLGAVCKNNYERI